MRTAVQFVRDGWRELRCLVKSAPIAYPKQVQCNVCGWSGRHFLSDSWHKHCICPRCHASVRHRLLFAAFEQHEQVGFRQTIAGKTILHFAPEKYVQRRIQRQAERYVTADLFNPRRDLQIDISDMQEIADQSIDAVIACDVLEHVPHDRRAMQEIYRVLRPGGYAILTVPQQDHRLETFEDPAVVDPEQRERLFGQWDHLRIYGEDFCDFLSQAGFRVTIISETDFPDKIVRRNVLFPPELSKHPLATNYRKVFFAHKPLAAALPQSA